MRPTNFDIHILINELNGTCESILSMLPDGMEEEDLTEQDTQEIDDHIFCCEGCGWWCEIDEQCEQCDHCIDCCDCN